MYSIIKNKNYTHTYTLFPWSEVFMFNADNIKNN